MDNNMTIDTRTANPYQVGHDLCEYPSTNAPTRLPRSRIAST
jgi:hypothetical protein